MNPADAGRRSQHWQDAQRALLALQLDGPALGGIWLRAGHGPVRDAWLADLRACGVPLVKIPAQVDDERLLGGIDLAHSLQTGRLVQQPGLLAQADGGAVLLPMAERLPPHTLAHVAQAMDQGQLPGLGRQPPQTSCFAVVALDEAEADEAGLAPRLSDRLGLWLDLRDLGRANTEDTLEPLSPLECARVRHQLRQVQASAEDVQALCETAMALGVDSLRAPLTALRLAAICAALDGRSTLEEDDLATAARMVLGPRATRLPAACAEPPAPAADAPPPTDAAAAPEAAPEADPSPEDPQADTTAPAMADEPPPPTAPSAEMLIAAAMASLPPHMLDRLLQAQGSARAAQGLGRSGQSRNSHLRGRPLGPRPGKPSGGARLHLLATLRAAAPRQRLRQRPPGCDRLQLRAEDFHVQRFAQQSPSCLIFALDASGSAALQRLAEAKGAVELLLQDSYARRDSVCVIAFRAAAAQTLLAPTRSLVRAKRALATLPGGGGTPLASGIQAALLQAHSLRRAGSTPMLVMLSDGRANVSAAGLGGRAQAQADALALAGQWRSSGFAALWIDTAAQPEAQAQALAQAMGANYFPMPYVQAQRMAAVVRDLSPPALRT